jgi:glycerol uptake facilitator protein
MSPFAGEIVGTMLLVLLGNGTVANVLLGKTKGNNSGWIVITTGWAFGVFTGAFVVASISGAHLNPAVTLSLALAGKFAWSSVPMYCVAQLIGAFLGAVLVFLHYYPHWAVTPDASAKLAAFSTSPAIRSPFWNLASEVIGTFVLILGILGIKSAVSDPSGAAVPINLGALGAVPVAFLVWVIGLSLGGTTGYAINPVRDLGPRIAHFVLPIPGKGGSEWSYAWIPVMGPLLGATVAALLYIALGSF